MQYVSWDESIHWSIVLSICFDDDWLWFKSFDCSHAGILAIYNHNHFTNVVAESSASLDNPISRLECTSDNF